MLGSGTWRAPRTDGSWPPPTKAVQRLGLDSPALFPVEFKKDDVSSLPVRREVTPASKNGSPRGALPPPPPERRGACRGPSPIAVVSIPDRIPHERQFVGTEAKTLGLSNSRFTQSQGPNRHPSKSIADRRPRTDAYSLPRPRRTDTQFPPLGEPVRYGCATGLNKFWKTFCLGRWGPGPAC